MPSQVVRARFGPFTKLSIFIGRENVQQKPSMSEVLSLHLKKRNPQWTSFFVKYENVLNDHFGMSNFNWKVGDKNFQILRTGCYPYMKYHCSCKELQDLTLEDNFFKLIKVLNLGLPTLAYGTVARYLISWTEIVETSKGNVPVYFLYKENYDAVH